MKHILVAAAITVAWSSSALAANIRIEPVETLGSSVEYRDGMAGASSRLAKSEAGLMVQRATMDENGVPALAIGVANLGQAPFNLTPANIKVTTQSGQVLTVFTREDVMAEVEAASAKRAKRARTLAALNSMGAAIRDQPSAPDRRLQEKAARAEEEGAANMAAASAYGFVAQTVHPGEKHLTDLGVVAVPRDASELTVAVTVAGETHIFPLRITRLR